MTLMPTPAAVAIVALCICAQARIVGDESTKAPAAKEATVSISDDPNDWPMYNRDARGTRHNAAEKTLAKENVASLVQKWRFPANGSGEMVGIVHGTPVVVNGYVYFGTETFPTVYKLMPDGR